MNRETLEESLIFESLYKALLEQGEEWGVIEIGPGTLWLYRYFDGQAKPFGELTTKDFWKINGRLRVRLSYLLSKE